jgi:hypothetical protein
MGTAIRCVLFAVMASPLALSAGAQDTEKPRDVQLGQRFELQNGESALVKSAGLRLTFASLAEDSRCPAGVQCVWAGDASVEVSLEISGEAETRLLHTNPRFDRETEFRGFRVELIDVRPQPREGTEIAPSDYVIALQIDKARK